MHRGVTIPSHSHEREAEMKEEEENMTFAQFVRRKRLKSTENEKYPHK